MNLLRFAGFSVVLLLVGCEKQNTNYAPGFSWERFDGLAVGMSESEVLQKLGPGFYHVYHVRYPNGSENNVLNKPEAGQVLMSYEIRYSKPLNERADFEVVGVIFNKDGKSIKTQHYKTD